MQIITSKIIPQTVTKHDIKPSRQKCFFLMKQCLNSYISRSFKTRTSQTKQSVIGLKMNDNEINRVGDSGEVCFGMNVNSPPESF